MDATSSYPVMGRTDRMVLDMRPRKTMATLRPEKTQPFSVTYISTAEVRVSKGVWTRCGIACALECDSGKDYKTLSGLSGNENIYIVLVDATDTANAKLPTKVIAYAYATALYGYAYERHLATLTGDYPFFSYQRRAGDIDDTAVISPGSTIDDVDETGSDEDGAARVKINYILAILRRHNLIDESEE